MPPRKDRLLLRALIKIRLPLMVHNRVADGDS